MGLCWASASSVHRSSKTTRSLQTHGHGGSNNHSNATDFFSSTTATTSSSVDRSQTSEAPDLRRSSNGQILETPNLKVYTFAELRLATKNFRPDTLLGQGGFGKVYRGWVDEKTLVPSRSGSGLVVAIKKLNPESVQGFQEWQSEVNFLGRLSHPNLVKLLGYCREDSELLLVYEFMPKGSLENHLFRRNAAIEPLSWELRLKIVMGAARGLAFLHSSDKQVIYRDFKASNILVDANYNAKLSDFGLAKLGPSGAESHVTTRIMGTYGYVAPEYMATGHLYLKSDVYGFGVVLLEMMTGLRAIDTTRPEGRQNLVEWLRPSLSKKRQLKFIMDTRIEGQYSSKAAAKIAQITLKCLETDPKKRSSMKEVLEMLEEVQAMEKQKQFDSSSSSKSTPLHRFGNQASHPRSPLHYRASPGRRHMSSPPAS